MTKEEFRQLVPGDKIKKTWSDTVWTLDRWISSEEAWFTTPTNSVIPEYVKGGMKTSPVYSMIIDSDSANWCFST